MEVQHRQVRSHTRRLTQPGPHHRRREQAKVAAAGDRKVHPQNTIRQRRQFQQLSLSPDGELLFVANATNNDGQDPETLFVSACYADEGPTAKRIRPRAQGRAYRIRKRTSHITVIVESRPAKENRGRKATSASGARAARAQGSKAAAAKKATATEASSEAKGGSN